MTTKIPLALIEDPDNLVSVEGALQAALDLKAPKANPTFTGTVTGVTKTHVGLGSVDNTADASKPVSTATQTALNLKANLASPAFTGTPTVPTATAGTSTTQVASTAFVAGEVAALIAAAPGALNTLDELAAAMGDDANFATTMMNALALKAPLASPSFTGTVGGITSTMVGLGNVTNTSDANKPVSTAQQTALDLKANLASPQFTGTPRGVTEADDDNGTKLATTAHVKSATGLKSVASLGVSDLNSAAIGRFIAVNGLQSDAAANNWPDSGLSSGASVWWNVLTFGSTTRATQIAIHGFNSAQGRMFMRMKHDSTWWPWVEMVNKTALDLKANIASPTFTGLVIVPTSGSSGAPIICFAGDPDTGIYQGGSADQLAITAGGQLGFVARSTGVELLLAPTAPTAAAGTNTTQLATTAFTTSAVALANTTLVPNLQTGTTYTLVLTDAGKRVSMANAASNVLTVPLNSSVAFPVNTTIFISQDGAGATSIAAAGGVTINTAEGLKVGGQYKMISIIKTATDTWLAIGSVA